MDHLHPSYRDKALLPAEERIAWMWSERWIGYPQGQLVLDHMSALLRRPKVHRASNMLIVGRSNNGKSTLMREFCYRNEAVCEDDTDGVRAPVVLIEAPEVPDAKRLYYNILDAIGSPVRSSYHVTKSARQVKELFVQMGVRVLIVDEIHNLLHAGHHKLFTFGNLLKTMTNTMGFTFVFVGTKEAKAVLRAMPQLGSRFKSFVLPQWQMDEDYFRLLDTFESIIPLRQPSRLSDPALALDILQRAEGLFGEILDLLYTAAEKAILNGQESITPDLLNSLGWESPSDRHRETLDE